MKRIAAISEMRAARDALAAPVGFVPTMGALHAGHASLVARARAECASVVASVFVNPLQFGPHEDYDRYPRALAADSEKLARLGADVLFAPAAAEMFTPDSGFAVTPGSVAAHLEGARRPHFFSGVATAVLKLFNIVRADRAYFGQKDAQQLAVIRQMVADLDLAIDVVGCPTVRESDGLALSSRNAYLNADERREAVRLSRALELIARRLSSAPNALAPHAQDVTRVIQEAEAALPPLKLDYLAVVDPRRFEPLTRVPPKTPLLAVGAAFAGTTRLIDNVEFRTP
jgi:pantoate--beta-alanine ligase